MGLASGYRPNPSCPMTPSELALASQIRHAPGYLASLAGSAIDATDATNHLAIVASATCSM